jgi:hypothetical protein
MTSIVQQYQNSDFETIGSVCWWNVHNVDIMKDALETILESCGIDKKFVRSHNYRSAFKRSLKELEEGRIIRPIDENASFMNFQFTEEQKIEDAGRNDVSLQYNPEAVVVIDKSKYRKTQNIAEAIEAREDIKERLVELFNEKKDKFHSSDVTRMIHRIFNEKADIVSLRQQGGVYFVPNQYNNILQAVSNFVNSVGSSTFDFFPMPDVEACRNAVAAAVDEEMTIDLNKLDEELKAFENGGEEMTDKQRNHRLGQMEKLRNRVTRYSELLTADAEQRILDSYERVKTGIMGNRALEF